MKVVRVGGHDDEEALGFLALYVDDMAVVGEQERRGLGQSFVDSSCRKEEISFRWARSPILKIFFLGILE